MGMELQEKLMLKRNKTIKKMQALTKIKTKKVIVQNKIPILIISSLFGHTIRETQFDHITLIADNEEVDEDDQGNEVQTEEDPADKEYEQVLDDPELKEKAQLPDVDPAKIKVEKKDMSGK